jgi:hypothetical protein
MKLYIDKITRQKEFKLTNEVTILCDIDELMNIKSFIDDACYSLLKANAKDLPHLHYKDFLKKGDSKITDIIIVLKEKEENEEA